MPELSEQPQSVKPKRLWQKFGVANALIAFTASIASIASLVLGVYLIEKRELTFLVHPIKTTVPVQQTERQLPRLKINYGGLDITNDLTALRIAFWNAGKRSIKNPEILEPIVISTGPGHRILDATFISVVRNVSHPILDKTGFSKGEVGLSWGILEHSDGGGRYTSDSVSCSILTVK